MTNCISLELASYGALDLRMWLLSGFGVALNWDLRDFIYGSVRESGALI